MSPLRAAAILALALLAAARGARADPCGHPDVVETFPEEGAKDVPKNIRFSARYAASAAYANESVVLEHVGHGAESLSPTFDSNDGILSATPSVPLVANDAYVLTWPGLRGGGSSTGLGAVVHFVAGMADDTEAPVFAGIRSIAWDVDRASDECTNDVDDRYVFDLGLDDAHDDGGKGLLTLLVFQSAGPHVAATGSPDLVLVRRFPEGEPRIEVRRATDRGAGRNCFAALVQDSLGRTSGGVDHEVCATTAEIPFFYGCHVAPGTRGSAEGGALLVFLAGLFWRRKRRGAHAAAAATMTVFGAIRAHAESPSDPGSTPASSTTEASRVGYAFRAEPVFGVGTGPFYNQLVGARLDYRFADQLRFGPYVAYANLKGPEGRVGNALVSLELEYRARLGGALELPLRWATGYLPHNGPVLRLSAGLGYAVSPHVGVALDLVSPAFWAIKNRTVVSLGTALQVSYTP